MPDTAPSPSTAPARPRADGAAVPAAGAPLAGRRALLGAALLLPLAAPALRRAAADPAARVSLIHLNDFHSHHEGVAAGAALCRPGQACFGGSARLATAVAAWRRDAAAAGRAPLLLDAGDQFTGTLFYARFRGMAEAAVQRAVGVQAMSLGNHEFDHGPDNLARYLALLPFPVLAANLDLAEAPLLRGRVTAWTSFAPGGRRLAVVGLLTPDTANASSPGPTVRFGDPAAALERALGEIRAGGPATVVVLSHLGLPADRLLARAVPGIDVVVGGHSHTLLANGLPGAEGPDPVMEEGPGGPVRIVQAGAHGRWLGRLDLDLSAEGRVQAHAGQVRELDGGVSPDPEVAAIVAAYAAPLGELRRQVVGRLVRALPLDGCRTGECALGNLVADAMLDATRGTTSGAADAALTNGGGLRAGLPEGAVSVGDVLAVLPFGNTLATVTLRGASLVRALENGFGRAPDAAGRFPQVAGMRVEWSADAPAGQRVRRVEVAGAPLDPERSYRLVTNNFVRRGGDDYDVLRDEALEAYDDGAPLEDALIARLGGGAPPPEREGRSVRR